MPFCPAPRRPSSSTRADVVVTAVLPADTIGELLLTIHFVAVARPDHPLFVLDRPLTADDLVRHVQVVVRDSGVKHPRDEGWLGAERRCTVSSMEASLATVQAGLGYAWLPEHLISDLIRQDRLRPLPLAVGGSRAVPLNLVLVRPQSAGPAARAAVEIFQRHHGSGQENRRPA